MSKAKVDEDKEVKVERWKKRHFRFERLKTVLMWAQLINSLILLILVVIKLLLK